MIDLYSRLTPNGLKLHITVEEFGITYNLHPVNITRGEQFEPDFLRISPNNKIPGLVYSARRKNWEANTNGCRRAQRHYPIVDVSNGRIFRVFHSEQLRRTSTSP